MNCLVLKKHLNHISQSFTYIVINRKNNHSWIIDMGDFEEIKEMIRDSQVQGILLTHIHYDHIYGLTDFISNFPDMPIYTNEVGLNLINNPYENLSFYYGTLIDSIPGKFRSVDIPENREQLLKQGIRCHFTPGHHPSCISWEIGQYLFTGDSHIPGHKVVTKLSSGNKEKAVHSENMIIELGKTKVICAGH